MGSKNMDLNEKMEILSNLELDDLSPAEQMLFTLALVKFLKDIDPILVNHKAKTKKEPEVPDDPISRMILEGLKKALEESDGENN